MNSTEEAKAQTQTRDAEVEAYSISEVEEISVLEVPVLLPMTPQELTTIASIDDCLTVSKQDGLDPYNANINSFETLLRAFNGVGLVTNLLAASALSVLTTTQYFTNAQAPTPIGDETSSPTSTNAKKIDSDATDAAGEEDGKDFLINALSKLACHRILPECHCTMEKSFVQAFVTDLPKALADAHVDYTRQNPRKRKKTKPLIPLTPKGKKWKDRVLARKRKQQIRIQNRKLQGKKSEPQPNQQSLEIPCDTIEDTNEEEIVAAVDPTNDNAEEKSETQNHLQCSDFETTVVLVAQQESPEDFSSNYTEENETCLQNEGQKGFAQLIIIPGSVDVRWKEYLPSVPITDIDGSPQFTDLEVLHLDEEAVAMIDDDLPQLDDLQELPVMIEDTTPSTDNALQSTNPEDRPLDEEGRMSNDEAPRFGDLTDLERDVLRFTNLQELAIKELHSSFMKDKVLQVSADIERDDVDCHEDRDQSDSDCTSFVTAGDILEYTLNDNHNPDRVNSSSSSSSSNSIIHSFVTADQPCSTADEALAIFRSNRDESTNPLLQATNDATTPLKTIILEESSISEIEVVVYGQHKWLSSSKAEASSETTTIDYSYLCCWLNSSWFSSEEVFSSEKARANKNGFFDVSSEYSLGSTQASSSNGSSKSSWFGGGNWARKSKPEPPWYIMPGLDPIDDLYLEESSSLYETNEKSDDDEGCCVSRKVILRELNRFQNSNGTEDRIMEIIDFPSTLLPARSEGVMVLN